MNGPFRPVMRYHGGKWLLAPWIISHFPPHRIYVEPFGGAASVLLRKERAYAEIYGDLDKEVVNLFRILRDEQEAQRLIDLLHLTPFSREEFHLAYRPSRSRIERARRLVVRSYMGFGSDGALGQYRTGFRSASNRSGTTPAHDWRNYPEALALIIDRLRGVVIENRDAMQVMLKHDAKDALHFVDPPYLIETRSRTNRRPMAEGGGTYRHEMTAEQHADLIAGLRELEGMVVLCGYPSDMYDRALVDWRREQRAALADGASPRTEVIWINPAAQECLSHGPLFGV